MPGPKVPSGGVHTLSQVPSGGDGYGWSKIPSEGTGGVGIPKGLVYQRFGGYTRGGGHTRGCGGTPEEVGIQEGKGVYQGLGMYTHYLPRHGTWNTHPPALAITTYMIGMRVVCILLECFLVCI